MIEEQFEILMKTLNEIVELLKPKRTVIKLPGTIKSSVERKQKLYAKENSEGQSGPSSLQEEKKG